MLNKIISLQKNIKTYILTFLIVSFTTKFQQDSKQIYQCGIIFLNIVGVFQNLIPDIIYLQQQMEKSQLRNKNKQPSKLNLQSISIFNYYLKTYFPNIFQTSVYPASSFTKLKASQRNMAYNYVYQQCSGIEDVTYEVILQSAKHIYSSMQGVSNSESGFMKKTVVKLPYLPIWRQISQKIDIFVIKQGQKDKEVKKRNFCSPYKLLKLNTQNTIQRKRSYPLISMNAREENKSKQAFQLYIIHHSSHLNTHSAFQWENFVQRYRFETKCIEGESRAIITYETVFAYNSQLKLDQSHKLLQIFYQSSLFSDRNQNKLPTLQRLYSKLRNVVQAEKAKLKIKLQSISYDQSHRRQLKLTPQQRIIFNSLKVKTFAYFSSINRNRDVNRYFLQNLICRMMSNQNYQQNQSWECIKYYLQFQKKMRNQYKWKDFQKYDKMNIFSYIGKDTMGRPILLNRLRNTLCSKIQHFDEFYYYHFYLFEIYMQDQMEGWVDQFVVIADASNQVSDNTNLGFTKRIILEALKLTMGRVYKIVAFDVSFIGTAFYRLIKPLLPNSFTDCVKLFGDNKNELLEELQLFISDQAIPQFIGGKNHTIDSTNKMDQLQQRLNTQRTNEGANMLKNVKSLKNL